MGQEITSSNFSQGDFDEFSRRLQDETDLLRQMLSDNAFDQSEPVAGYELEAWLTDAEGRPSPSNDRFLELLGDPEVVAELERILAQNPDFVPGYRYLGMLRRENIIRAYNRAITHRTNITHRLKSIKKHGVPDINVMEIVITAEMTCAERRLGDFAGQLPPDSIVASIQRSNRVLIPRGDTILQVGDHLTLLVKPDQAEAVQSAFC